MRTGGLWPFTARKSKKAGARPAFSLPCDRRSLVLRDHRTSPVEAVVDAGLHDMVVGAEAAERSQRSWRREAGIAEVVVLVLDLARPVLGEHVFETSADGPTVAVIARQTERQRRACAVHQRIIVVGEGITALHVEQARTPGVTDAARDGADATLVVGEDVAIREYDAAVVAGNPGVLGFRADHPVRGELIVSAALHTAEEAAVVVVTGGQAAEIGIAREHAAEVAADVEAGPVIERSDIGRRLGIGGGPGRKVGSQCWHGRAEGDESHSCK